MSRPIRVLLVEDSPHDAALLLLELRRGGYEPLSERVETRAAMSAALDRQAWDVIIADYVLPGFSGPKALELLQQKGLDLPFIIVSGHIDEDTAVKSMKAGAHDYVMKDRLTRLVPAIEREMQEAEVRQARRRSEGEFAREQKFRHTIEDSIPSGISAIDGEGRLTYVNPAFCEMVGWKEAELLGAKPPFVFWAPEAEESLQAALALTLAGKSPANGFELRFQHCTGRRFDVLVLLRPIHDANGGATGWLASATDITERKQAEQRLRVQYEVARVLSEASSLQAAATKILEIIGESMGWEAGALWRAAPNAAELHCVEVWHEGPNSLEKFEAASRQMILAKGLGLPGRVLAEGKPVWFADMPTGKDMPRAKIAIQEGLHGACGFPIRLGTEVLGVIELFSHQIREPEKNLMHWMASIGSQVGQFMERELAQESLRRAHGELEQRVRERTGDLMAANANLETAVASLETAKRERERLEHELLEITEKERRRIGLDLHDDLGQKLAGVALMMKGLEVGLTKKKLPEAADAQRISGLISQAIDHASGLARNLTLGDLENENLPSALEDLAANVKHLFAISCKFKSEGAIQALDRNTITQFYKITQEAVTNAVKHGKAREVGIHLTQKPDRLVLTVRNNGLPFPSMIDKSKGMGLRIMNYRANVIGASLDVSPKRPHGTIVTCCLPTPGKLAKNGDGTPSPSPRVATVKLR
ncbi:MAG: hypothetical protein JWR69_478 [Pedosphaera sp.]|nr:hypothetical protein [Pedosphaera sp.]